MKRVTRKTPNRWIPRRLVSRFAECMYRTRLSRVLIVPYIRRYGVNMEEFVRPIEEYDSLVDFFCREIKPELRPIAADRHMLVSPVDGRIAEFGMLKEHQLIQAKGIDYSSDKLLGDEEDARRYKGGLYITIYLSPADYHRIHAPASGHVGRATFIPGSRWPVNQSGVEGIQQLFEKNERLITYLDSNEFGRIAIVKVGAYIIGKIRVSYAENFSLKRYQNRVTVERWLTKGDEVGQFEFGSTVILLIEPGSYRWSEGVTKGNRLKMGQPILERV